MGGPNANINNLTAVHMGSGGLATSTPPDVCMTPGPSGPPQPVPYVNLALSADLVGGTTTTFVNDQSTAIMTSKFAKSSGDEPGVAGGVMSGVNMNQASWLMGSPTVTMEDTPVNRLSDKMLMNMSNTTCVAGEVQAPAPPPTPLVMPPPEEPQICKLQNMVLECSHCSKRSYKLDADRTPASTLQVITSPTAEKVKVDFQAHCSIHSGAQGCAKVHVLGPDGKEVSVDADHSFEIPLKPRWNVTDVFSGLLLLVGAKGVEGDLYTVTGTTCETTGSSEFLSGEFALVEVFPNAGFSGEITFGYEIAKEKRTDGKKPAPTFKQDEKTGDYTVEQAPLHELGEQGKWTLSGSLKVTVGRSSFNPSYSVTGDGSKKDSDPLSRKLCSVLQKTLDMLARMLSSIEDYYSTKLDIRWPLLKLGGTVDLVEVKEKAEIAREGTFYITAEPLIGAQVKIDILDWLIRFAGALGGPAAAAFAEYLIKIKRRLAEGKLPGKQEKDKEKDKEVPFGGKLEIGIIFTVGGDVGGGLGWKCDATGVNVDGSKAKIEAGLDMKLEALIKVEAKVWIVKSSAGVSISMLAADGKSASRIAGQVKPKPNKKKNEQPVWGNYFGLTGAIEFNGLAIYYAYYAEIGLEAKEAKDDKNAADKDKKKGAGTLKTPFKNQSIKESKELCTLLKPWSYPDFSKPNVVEMF